MSILLKRLIEQQDVTGQYYDLNKDFSTFKQTIAGADDQIKQRFENAIKSKLINKRINAEASRGYKQYLKRYSFDVANITIDNAYDNYVVVAHDNTTPKPKEYFLKPGSKIQILGPATGEPSPKKEKQPIPNAPAPTQPKQNPNAAQHQPMVPAPPGKTPSEMPMKEGSDASHYDAYSTNEISKDVKNWLPELLIKPETELNEFIKKLGWAKDLGNGKSVAMYDIKLPVNELKGKLTPEYLRSMLAKTNLSETNTNNSKCDLISMKLNDGEDEWQVRIKKTINSPK